MNVEKRKRTLEKMRRKYPEKLSDKDDVAIVKQFLKGSKNCGIESL